MASMTDFVWMSRQLGVEGIVATDDIAHITYVYENVYCATGMGTSQRSPDEIWENEGVLEYCAKRAYTCALLRMRVRDLLSSSAKWSHLPPIEASLQYALRCHGFMFGLAQTYTRQDGVSRRLDDIGKDMLHEIRTYGPVSPWARPF